MKKYRSKKSGQAIMETYDRLLAAWQCEKKKETLKRNMEQPISLSAGRRMPLRWCFSTGWATTQH